LVGGLDHPTDVIQDAFGYINVTVAGHKKNDGKVLRLIPGRKMQTLHENLERPIGISADANGNLFYIEEGTSRVWEYMGSLGLQVVSERGVNTKGIPLALASDRDGNVFVLQNHPNRVYRFELSYHTTSM
jgi:sugar lactone lactonase YvrE